MRRCWKVLGLIHFSESVFLCLVIKILFIRKWVELRTFHYPFIQWTEFINWNFIIESVLKSIYWTYVNKYKNINQATIYIIVQLLKLTCRFFSHFNHLHLNLKLHLLGNDNDGVFNSCYLMIIYMNKNILVC